MHNSRTRGTSYTTECDRCQDETSDCALVLSVLAFEQYEILCDDSLAFKMLAAWSQSDIYRWNWQSACVKKFYCLYLYAKRNAITVQQIQLFN